MVVKKEGMNKGLKITLIVLAVIGVIFLLIVGLLVFVGLKSGGLGYSEVTPIVDEFYSALQTKDYAKADTLLHPAINETLKQDFNKLFKYLEDNLGTVESYSKDGFNVQSFPSGKSTIVMTYNVNRTKYSAFDTITFYRDSGEEKYGIVSYNSYSEGLVPNALS